MALKDNEFFERTIRGVKIIHVALEHNANVNDVLNYIKENINPEFNGSVSGASSSNNIRNGSIHWYIKDEDNILAVYYDGGAREGRDENYDFVDLRWLGNGSAHMYCFWKTDNSQYLLEHHELLKAAHAKNNDNLVINSLLNKTPGIKKINIAKIMKKIVEKVIEKEIKDLFAGNFIISGLSGLASEKLAEGVGNILESDPDALKFASKLISGAENFIMGAVDAVVNNLAKRGLEAFKT